MIFVTYPCIRSNLTRIVKNTLKNQVGCVFQCVHYNPSSSIVKNIFQEPFWCVFQCVNCDREAFAECSVCRRTPYCSSFCQRRDWNAHQVVCSQGSSSIMLIVESSEQVLEHVERLGAIEGPLDASNEPRDWVPSLPPPHIKANYFFTFAGTHSYQLFRDASFHSCLRREKNWMS